MDTMDHMEKLALRISEFAEAIGVSRSKGYELVADGTVPSVKFGSTRRVPVDAVRALIEKQIAEQARKSES
jgi:excisionase family DNA binding protein